jgi:bifunctional enzyme CysN/CysC
VAVISRIVADDFVMKNCRMTREQRYAALGMAGATVLLTGLPGAGKTSLGAVIEEALIASGRPAVLLDGDAFRLAFCSDLGFSREDRSENARRAGHLARFMADSGIVVLLALICPYAHDRAVVRELQEEDGIPFLEVFVNTPLEICEARDPKGLYKRARSGQIPNFTGVSDPYEVPENPDLVFMPADGNAILGARRIIEMLEESTPQIAERRS